MADCGASWHITDRNIIPVFYAAWRWGLLEPTSETSALPGLLSRVILTLSAIKLLQNKSNRDWVFLYLMAFFQILLAAGLSISPLYLAAFSAFLFTMVCAVILLEMRRLREFVDRASSESSIDAQCLHLRTRWSERYC